MVIVMESKASERQIESVCKFLLNEIKMIELVVNQGRVGIVSFNGELNGQREEANGKLEKMGGVKEILFINTPYKRVCLEFPIKDGNEKVFSNVN